VPKKEPSGSPSSEILSPEDNVQFYPAFDDAFVDDASLKLPDGLHPTEAGIEAVVTRIIPMVETLIDRAS
jgi:acyl-CoA thioesterase-1